MSFLRKKPFLWGGLLVIGLVVLPATIFFVQHQQEVRSRAEKSVNLSYDPSTSQNGSALQVPAGSTFTLDVYADPGDNSVSYVKVEMVFDPTKFEPAGTFIPNVNAFSQVQGTVVTNGKETVILSVGSDFTKAITKRTLLGTLSLKALDNVPANTTSVVSFGSGSQALSVSSNSSFDENVIASTTPTTIQINKPVTSCGNTPSDSMLLMDTSDSMNSPAGSSGTKLTNAKAAATHFVTLVSGQTTNRVGLTTFDNTGYLKSGFTNAFATVKTAISGLTTKAGTCMSCGIDKANAEITAHKRAGVKNIVILLTDGRANWIEGHTGYVSNATAEKAALDAAAAGHKANGTVFYTIGLGNDVFSDFLKQLATSTGGKYFFTPTTDQLDSIYTQISQILEGGQISGMVFNDANGNGGYDQGEVPMHGVLVKLFPANNTTTPSQIISTDSDGTYSMNHICDGSYLLKEVLPPLYKQTLPKNLPGYNLTMSNGNALTDKNFGNQQLPRCSDGIDNDGNGFTDAKDSTCHTDGNPNNPNSYDPNLNGENGNSTCSDSKDNNGNGLIDGEDPVCHTDLNANNSTSYDPTRDEGFLPTPTPSAAPSPSVSPSQAPSQTPSPSVSPSPSGGTSLLLNVFMHGIGNSGDNANPTASSLSNKSPQTPTRNAVASIYDINNNLVDTATGNINYSSDSGSFTGTVVTGHALTPGKYIIKVRSDFHLTRLVTTIQDLVATQTNTVPDVTLVAGDVNNDNRLDILDYNMILDCYSDLSPAANCSDPAKKASTDLNDDGGVNQFDYNLFLREISTQPGD